MATKLVSGNRMVEVEMQLWNGFQYTPDWSYDFFNVGTLKYDNDLDAYEVDDIDYCIEQANDWMNKEGDYYGEEDVDGIERVTTVEEIDFPPMTKDGHYVVKGDWISNTSGIYEVRDVSHNRIECREVVFESDDCDEFHLDVDRSIFTNYEIHHRFTYY